LIGRKRPFVRQPKTAIEGHPTHQLGVNEMPAAAAYFPNAFLLLLPIFTDIIDQAPQMDPKIIRYRTAVLVLQVH
jgi:hypothetical protein